LRGYQQLKPSTCTFFKEMSYCRQFPSISSLWLPCSQTHSDYIHYHAIWLQTLNVESNRQLGSNLKSHWSRL